MEQKVWVYFIKKVVLKKKIILIWKLLGRNLEMPKIIAKFLILQRDSESKRAYAKKMKTKGGNGNMN